MACSRMPKCMLRPANSGLEVPGPFACSCGCWEQDRPSLPSFRADESPELRLSFPDAMRVAIGPSVEVNVGRLASQSLGSCRCMTR